MPNTARVYPWDFPLQVLSTIKSDLYEIGRVKTQGYFQMSTLMLPGTDPWDYHYGVIKV